VLVAFGADVLIAVAKSAAAAVTGSASLVAEAAHSWADTGNQIFLLIADRRSHRPRDDAHPFGYGREAYVWSLFAALGLLWPVPWYRLRTASRNSCIPRRPAISWSGT
jgi:divalent metal cation (Fe/Co/Zn/Cd) transporter